MKPKKITVSQFLLLKNLKIAEVNVKIPRSKTETEEKIVTVEDGKEATSVVANTAVSATAVGGIKGGNVLQTVGSFIVQIEPAKVGYSGEWMDLKVEVMSA